MLNKLVTYKFAKQNNILLFSSVFDEWSTDLNYKNNVNYLKLLLVILQISL